MTTRTIEDQEELFIQEEKKSEEEEEEGPHKKMMMMDPPDVNVGEDAPPAVPAAPDDDPPVGSAGDSSPVETTVEPPEAEEEEPKANKPDEDDENEEMEEILDELLAAQPTDTAGEDQIESTVTKEEEPATVAEDQPEPEKEDAVDPKEDETKSSTEPTGNKNSSSEQSTGKEEEASSLTDLEMKQKVLDQKEKELTEREEALQQSLLQLAEREETLHCDKLQLLEEKKRFVQDKHKLSALLTKLVDVEVSIQDLLGNESSQSTNQLLEPPTHDASSSSIAAAADDIIFPTKDPIPFESPAKVVRVSATTTTTPPSSKRLSITVPGANVTVDKFSQDLPTPGTGACYLVYESDSSGRLVEYYSKTTPIENAIGRWSTVGTKKIAGFKFKNPHGNVIIAGCSGGVQGRKKYFSGWCSFVRSACQMQSELIMWDPPGKGLNVDVWVYTNDKRPGRQSIKLEPGEPILTEGVLGVAVLPKKTQFYDQAMTIDLDKWLGEGFDLGGSVRI